MRFNIKRCLVILLACIFIPLSILSAGNSNWFILDQTTKEQSMAGNSLSSNETDVTIGETTVTKPNQSTSLFLVPVKFYYWTMAILPDGCKNETVSESSASKQTTSTGLGKTPAEPTISFTVNGKSFSAGIDSWESYSNPYLLHTFEGTETIDQETGILTKIYHELYLISATDNTTSSGSWLNPTKTRTGTVTYRLNQVTETYQAGLVTEGNSTKIFHTAQVALGSTVNKPTLTYGDYALIGFYNMTIGSSTPSTEFDFTKPITTEDINYFKDTLPIIVQWSTQSDTNYDTTSYNSLTDSVNSLSGTLNAYANGAHDITKDVTYSSSSAALNLGKKSTATTIQSGATVNLCMNSGTYQYEAIKDSTITDVDGNEKHAIVGDDYFASLDYTGKTQANATKKIANPRDYTVRLQNNLTIKGTLNLGGYTGATLSGGFSPQGSIIGNYVKLDLNGYTITIENGGILHSFGYITDSVGTGKIVVKEGGNLYSQMVIASLKGGNSTLWSYAKGISPFENYYFPYLDTQVEIQATSSGAGNFTAYTKLNLGDLGFTNMYFPIMGGDSSYMFYIKAKSGSNGVVRLTRAEVESLNVEPFTYQDLKKNCFNFENVDAIFNPPNVKVIASMDLSSVSSLLGKHEFPMTLELNRIVFPISSFLDMNFYSSTFTLSQKIQVMPGASIMVDENSELILGHSNGKVTFEDKQVKVSVIITFTKTMPGESKYLSGGILAMDNDPIENSQYIGSGYDLNSSSTTTKLSYTDYWNKVFESANVDVYGNIKFMTGNASEAPYTLAGNINVNTFSTSADTTKKAWNTQNLSTLNNVYFNSYDLNIFSGNFYWFGSSSITSSSNDSAYSAALRFYAQPMISNGVAYLHDANNNLQGSYNSKTGIFTSSTGTKYFFLANNSLLTTSSQESVIDYKLTPTVVTNELKDCLITVGAQNYAYFGGLYFPITSTGVTASTTSVTANLQKFSSNSSYVAAKTLTYQNGYWKIAT